MTFRDLILKSKVYTLWLQKANTSPQGKHHAHLDTLKDIYLHKFLLRQCFIDIQNYNLNQIISCQSMSEAVKKKKKGDDIIWRFEWRLFRAPIISGSVCIICRTKTQMITRQFSVEAAPLGECGLGRNWGILEFLISLSFTMLC